MATYRFLTDSPQPPPPKPHPLSRLFRKENLISLSLLFFILLSLFYIYTHRHYTKTNHWKNTPTSRLHLHSSSRSFYSFLSTNLASKKTKAVVLVVYSPSCSHCRMMQKPVQELSEVFDEGDLKFGVVAIEEGGIGLARKFRITSVPAFVLFREGWEKDERMVRVRRRGRSDKEHVEKWLREQLAETEKMMNAPVGE